MRTEPLTQEQRDKLLKSVGRLIARHGWWAFAQALADACESGANCWHTYPQSAALWRHRADTVRPLAQRTLNPPPIAGMVSAEPRCLSAINSPLSTTHAPNP